MNCTDMDVDAELEVYNEESLLIKQLFEAKCEPEKAELLFKEYMESNDGG